MPFPYQVQLHPVYRGCYFHFRIVTTVWLSVDFTKQLCVIGKVNTAGYDVVQVIDEY